MTPFSSSLFSGGGQAEASKKTMFKHFKNRNEAFNI
jgi:hypothetical protein